VQHHEVEARVARIRSLSRGVLVSNVDCERTQANARREMKED